MDGEIIWDGSSIITRVFIREGERQEGQRREGVVMIEAEVGVICFDSGAGAHRPRNAGRDCRSSRAKK